VKVADVRFGTGMTQRLQRKQMMMMMMMMMTTTTAAEVPDISMH